MNKYILLLTPFFLFGCATLSTTGGSSKSVHPDLIAQRDKLKPSTEVSYGGFNYLEAEQLLEMCIELNNQDDRSNPEKNADLQYKAKPGNWKIVYDSRHPGNTEWNTIWPATQRDPEPNDPNKNGFGPFNNAWLLAQSEIDPMQYAIVIRGTVGEINSILADAFATKTPAYAGIEFPKDRVLPITFAATPKAELHLGFAYAAFTMLFDKEKGILTQLHKLKLPENAKLLITGHSQGAAIATLIHSFLYYAITDPHDRFKLRLKFHFDTQKSGNTVQLKSYLFAQPKPGNQQYAEDFAHISKDMAYVINNDLDPVGQVPLSLQVLSDVLEGVEVDNAGKGGFWEGLAFWNAQTLTDFKIRIRSRIAQKGLDHVAESFAKKQANLAIDEYFSPKEHPVAAKASSLNYTLAGQLVPVFGVEKGGNLYPNTGNKPDILLQHHATSYRILINQQFNNKP